MLSRFIKMHGCGNDFVILDERREPLGLTPARIAAVADRRTGVGCDQVITVHYAPDDSNADIMLRFFNSDGSEAGACGNGTRCAAALFHAETGRPHLIVQTVSGNLPAQVHSPSRVTVNMGQPRLEWPDIPLSEPADTLHLPLTEGPVADPVAVSMGNPHVTFFVGDVAAVPVGQLGPVLEAHSLFQDRANIGFAEIPSSDRIRLRVWERGAGLTAACGSGACAAVVNAHRRGLISRRAIVDVDGGELEIEWLPNNHVLMTGPVATAFTGEVDLSTYPA